MKDGYRNFTLLISSVYRNINKIKVKEMAELGLRGTHVTCLFYLYAYGDGLTAAQLSALSGEDKAAISRSVCYLNKNGYIYFEGKNYRRPLFLTEKGKETATIVYNRVEEFVVNIDSGMTEKERLTLYKALEIVEKNLKDNI